MLKTTRARLTPSTRPTPAELLWSVLRALQLILALTAAGIYGRDLHRASSAHEHADSRWVYAAVVCGLSVIAALAALLVPALRRRGTAAGSGSGWWWWPVVDGVVFFLWVVVFAVFARLYLREDCEGSGACERMKAGVWVDLVAMVAWFVAFVAGAFCFWRERHSRSIFTGRAAVV